MGKIHGGESTTRYPNFTYPIPPDPPQALLDKTRSISLSLYSGGIYPLVANLAVSMNLVVMTGYLLPETAPEPGHPDLPYPEIGRPLDGYLCWAQGPGVRAIARGEGL